MGSMVAAYGQGYVNFSNYYSSSQTTGVIYGNGPDVGLGAGSEISVTLLYGAATDTLISQLTPLSFTGSSGQSPIALSGNPGPVHGSGPGVFAGGIVNLPAGGSYAFAVSATGTLGGNSYTGVSAIFTGSAVGPATPVGNLPLGLQQSTILINAVPEPTTLALAGLGGLASLVALRRKKA